MGDLDSLWSWKRRRLPASAATKAHVGEFSRYDTRSGLELGSFSWVVGGIITWLLQLFGVAALPGMREKQKFHGSRPELPVPYGQ